MLPARAVRARRHEPPLFWVARAEEGTLHRPTNSRTGRLVRRSVPSFRHSPSGDSRAESARSWLVPSVRRALRAASPPETLRPQAETRATSVPLRTEAPARRTAERRRGEQQAASLDQPKRVMAVESEYTPLHCTARAACGLRTASRHAYVRQVNRRSAARSTPTEPIDLVDRHALVPEPFTARFASLPCRARGLFPSGRRFDGNATGSARNRSHERHRCRRAPAPQRDRR